MSLATNLKARVLALAGIAADDLPARGSDILDARLNTLIVERKVNEREMRALSESLRKQFPKSVSKEPGLYPPRLTPSPMPGRRSESPAGPLGRKATNSGSSASKLVKSADTASIHHGCVNERATALTPSPVSVQRQSVRRKRQLAAADAHFVESIRKDAKAHEEDEQRRVEAKLAARESMRRDMELHAQIVDQRKAQEREERQHKRLGVLQGMDDIKVDEIIEIERRKAKFAKEKADIEKQRVARRHAQELAEARKKYDDVKYRAEIGSGLTLDEDVTNQRKRETRATLVEFLNESKVELEMKRRQQVLEKERANAEAHRASPLLPGGRTSPADAELPSGYQGMSSLQATKVAARRRIQEAVLASHETVERERKAAADRLEEAAMEAERRTAAEQHRRNEQDKSKARQMRAALVASLDREMEIHRERADTEAEDKKRLRKIADADADEAERVRQAALVQTKQAQETLRTSLAHQIAAREKRMEAPQEMKLSQRPTRFLPKQQQDPR
jgi:hypothetical protein